MKNKARENSIRSLVSLYTVVIGVALSVSVVRVVDSGEGVLNVWAPAEWMLFSAFLFTLLPFYHGAIRHLDDAYLENTNPQIRGGALIIDLMLLIGHAMAFVVLAMLLSEPSKFAWVLVGLITVDVVWGVFTHFAASTKSENAAEWRWALINLVFVLVGFSLLFVMDISWSNNDHSKKIALIVFVASLLRSLADYIWCWNFYFPADE